MIARIAAAALGIGLAALVGGCDPGGTAAPAASSAPASAAPASSATPASSAAPAAEPAASTFVHAKGLDMFGYYMPTSETVVGRYRLDSIDIGQPSDFTAWERGERSKTNAPVMVMVSDVTSPKHTNELSQEYHEVQIRVTPDSYRVEPGYFEFTGHDAKLGRVMISGGFDAKALARAKQAGPNVDQATVITGGMEFAGERIRNISFFWFAGD
jgi:hypothetical protein